MRTRRRRLARIRRRARRAAAFAAQMDREWHADMRREIYNDALAGLEYDRMLERDRMEAEIATERERFAAEAEYERDRAEREDGGRWGEGWW